ncbi:MAG: hypothetical protein C5S43_00085 [Candidatus Methanocomedens sp.]|nr:MAG: hypothetical protein C5S43_00085 [ANME-2 cluster archaeon]
MVSTQVVCNNARIFGIDGVLVNAHCKGADGFVHHSCTNGTHHTGIESAAKQKSYRYISMQSLFYSLGKQIIDMLIHLFYFVVHKFVHLGNIPVANKFFSIVYVSGRKGLYHSTKLIKCFHLTGKHNLSIGSVSVEHGADSDGVPGGIVLVHVGIIKDADKFGIQAAGSLLHTQLQKHGDNHFAVTFRLELI